LRLKTGKRVYKPGLLQGDSIIGITLYHSPAEPIEGCAIRVGLLTPTTFDELVYRDGYVSKLGIPFVASVTGDEISFYPIPDDDYIVEIVAIRMTT
jgi:hypothetical protein